MTDKPLFPRDVFIDELYEAASKDKDIVIISADFGAPALDRFRDDLPDQFIHSGISEQHMIDMAAGMALCGKKVYAYAMAPFLSLRCYEQIKAALSLMDLPVTLLSVGVGVGYADAGPTHYITEDLACLRALNGMEVVTTCDPESSREVARLTLSKPALRYIRLDRDPELPVYNGDFSSAIDAGMHELHSGDDVCLVTSGYLMGRALATKNQLAEQGINAGVIDLFRIKPLNGGALRKILGRYKYVVTLEEQGLDGGFGSAVLEAVNDHGISTSIKRLGLPERYFFENGGRNYILDNNGLSVGDISKAVTDLLG